MRISFTGDIMCELPLLLHWEKDRSFAFSGMAYNIKNEYNSDYVVSNLETIFAGEEAKYTNDLYSFNTPDEFVTFIKESGIDLVSTANNHCMDRGSEGLIRTLKILNENQIDHTGTYDSSDCEPFFIKSIGNKQIGFISYTYGTNYGVNHQRIDHDYQVNLLKPQEVGYNPRKGFGYVMDHFLKVKTRVRLKKLMGFPVNSIRTDTLIPEDMNEEYLGKVDEKISRLKSMSDYTFALIHSGGQFNSEPGSYTEYIVDRLLNDGIDFIICNHPHVVQKSKKCGNQFCAYSLGNFFLSPDSIYLLRDNLPDYSIVIHFDILDDAVTVSFSISFIELMGNKGLRTIDSYKYYLSHGKDPIIWDNIKRIYCKFTNSCNDDFSPQHEYKVSGFEHKD